MENELEIKSYSQRYTLWRILSSPIRLLLKNKCNSKIDTIKKCDKQIELCLLLSRRSGKTILNAQHFLYNIYLKQKCYDFLKWWS